VLNDHNRCFAQVIYFADLLKNLFDDLRRKAKGGFIEKENFGIGDKSARATLPKLNALRQGTREKVNVSYYEGLEGIKQASDYNLKENQGKEMVGFYAHVEGMPEELLPYFDEYGKRLNTLGITVRAVAPESPSLSRYRKVDKNLGRDVKVVPKEEYSSIVALETVGETTKLTDLKNLQALVIENAEVAKTVRQIFEMVWRAT